MDLELRILAGLHRGACTPVTPGDELRLGSSEDNDVVLVDPGWAERPVPLRVSERGWTLGDEGAEQPLGTTTDWLGLRFTVCDAKAPWSFDEVAPKAAASDVLAAQAQLGPQEQQEPPAAADETKPSPGAQTLAAVDEAAEPQEMPPQAKPPRRPPQTPALWRRWALSGGGVAVAALAAISLASAYAPQQPKHIDALLQAGEPAAAAASTPVAPVRPSAEELRNRFTQRLREAELLPHLEIQFNADGWQVRGNLGPDEAQRLERVIVRFIEQQRPGVGIETTILAAEELLPFRIREIRAGAMAAVVTSEGRRLYVGDSASGYTLAKVESNRVIFTGKRRIEVPW
jgi:type III secretion protein D